MALDDNLRFIQNTWQIDCPNIEIFEIKDNKKICSVSGTISQNSDGILELKAFSNDFKAFGRHPFGQYSDPGKLCGYKYRIEAYPYSGEKWVANSHSISYSSGENGAILKSQLFSIKKVTTIPQKINHPFISMLLTPIEEFPSLMTQEYDEIQAGTIIEHHARNKAELEIENIKIEIVRDNNIIKVSCYACDPKFNSQISTSLKIKILESLQFILGRRLQIIVLEQIKSGDSFTELYSIKTILTDKILPPIVNLSFNQKCWDLFRFYFEKCFKEKEDKFYKLSIYNISLLESGGASIEAQCLTLSVAIEGLVDDFFQSIKVDSEISKKEVADIKNKLKELSLTAEKKDRINNLIDMLRQIRVKDRLHNLEKDGLIAKKLIDAWDAIRNKAAHGKLNINDDNFQEYYDYYNKMIVLFYHLTFLIIGYTGEYSDYSTYGYPARNFTAILKI